MARVLTNRIGKRLQKDDACVGKIPKFKHFGQVARRLVPSKRVHRNPESGKKS